MQASVRRQVLWDPLGSDRFIVGGNSEVKLYQWNSHAGEVKILASQSELTHMRCLSWSPHPTVDDLVAVGLTTGNVELFRLGGSVASLPNSHNSLEAPRVATLPVRYQRPCHAIEFSPIDPNYLAVGLEKTRNEPSLLIWDIERSARALPSPSSALPAFRRTSPRLPATRPAMPLGGPGDSRPLQYYGSTEVIHSLAFLPGTPHILIAGIGTKRIGMYDLRSPGVATAPTSNPPTGNASQPLAYYTKAVYGITVDPLDDNRFASYGDDMNIRLWDRRWTDPVMTWTEMDAGANTDPRACNVSAIQFSKARRGILGSLMKDANVVRLWDILDHRREILDSAEAAENSSSRWGAYQLNRTHSRATSTASTVLSAHGVAGTLPDGPILSHTSTGGFSKKGLSSFAFAPPQPCSSLIPRIVTVSRDGALNISAVLSSDIQTWSSRGMLASTSRAQLDTKAETDSKDEVIEVHSSWNAEGEWIVPEPWEVVDEPLESAIGGALGLAPTLIIPEERSGRALDRQSVPSLKKTAASRSSSAAPSGRSYSPAALRRIPLGKHRRIRSASPLPLDVESGTDNDAPLVMGGKKSLDISPAMPETYWKDTHMSVKSTKGGKIESAMREDISMIMRRRAIKGYGIKNFARNADIVSETQPSVVNVAYMWRWLEASREVLSAGASSRINGFEFKYQGVLGIWEGFSPITAAQTSNQGQLSAIDSPTYSPLLGATIPQGYSSPALGYNTNLGLSRPPSQRGGKRGERHRSPQRDNYDAAISILNVRRDSMTDNTGDSGATFTNPDSRDTGTRRRFGRLGRRRLALALCGWDISDAEIRADIARWLKEGKCTKAACWAAFLNDFKLAVEALMHSSDEMHRIISGIVVAAETEPDRRLKGAWREHCQKLGSRLEDPYLRIMMAHLAFDDWITVVEEAAIPLRDRLNIALRFLDDGQLGQFFQSVKKDLERSGDLEALLFTGLTSSGLRVLQRYVDNTGDVQTPAILTALVCPGILQDERSERWIFVYQDLLDNWRMFHQRCQFDIEKGEILRELVLSGDREPFEWVPRQLAMRCNFCDKIVNATGPTDFGKSMTAGLSTAHDRIRLTFCPHCRKALPRCDVCLMSLSGPLSDFLRDSELSHMDTVHDTFDDALVFCQTCRHGGHAVHIMEWFFGNEESETSGHRECPVADCTCNCALEAGYEDESDVQ
ncbi:WD repeat protein, putative [Rhizoctonia solani AG-3 Rhs1AP]|uniref:WD repeat protein, putative n=1 Tax=Rhizoctonia solani AG-3 Rhs1AP TaxID=1086054 RepID=X8JT93_9AGAM|nr:WD repeat protein, putative [Rhizoctonia solani AG-3 Rhs1AP]